MTTLTVRPLLVDAECAQPVHHPDVWFPHEDDSAGIAAAKAICNRCPVAAACLLDALTTGEPFGVRGGHTEGERRAMLGVRRRHPKTVSNTPRRTHCRNGGHPMTADNVYVNSRGERECKPCAQARKKRAKA